MEKNNILDRLSALDSNTVADALALLSLGGAIYGLQPLWKCPKIVGRVNTLGLGVIADTAASAHPFESFLHEESTDNQVLVIEGGINGVSCYDNIISNASKSKRIRGVIIDGVCGDNKTISQAGYPVYCRGRANEHYQVAQVRTGMPIKLRGFVVHQHDYVVADGSGTVFISAGHIEKVLEAAEHINHRQTLAVQSIKDGLTASEVLSLPPLDTRGSLVQGDAKDRELVALFAALDTPAVSDALDKIGLPGQATNIMPLSDYKQATVGPAFTVRYIPAATSGPPKGVGDWIDDVSPGDIIVIDNSGRKDCTVWGDIMTQYAGIRGIAGTVIDGVCRDVTRAISDNYPMFTAGRWVRTAKGRMEVASVNEPIGIGSVYVKPRDIVIADANGVVIVPRNRAREVAKIAHWIDESEKRIREMIANGSSLGKARAEIGYHELQSKDNNYGNQSL
ncbi:probable demethylmenaquinone methyltransferase [Fusarium torulosum]|uniref:Probable demethylmenaquinone methyltransferase n=1 Tax=Fusarium torulosum TaxID=33205 RepID=A0AAE8M9I1_9HYPO|nr:probable demethylmenaquinone methyltransferase [Fusarium torulosum]